MGSDYINANFIDVSHGEHGRYTSASIKTTSLCLSVIHLSESKLVASIVLKGNRKTRELSLDRIYDFCNVDRKLYALWHTNSVVRIA